MKKMLAYLASLRLAVILLVALLVGLSVGTILETRLGVEEAGRLVYYSYWFLGLQGLFAINLAMSIAEQFPWARKQAGFVVVHASLLLIMAGAAASYFLKIEGTMRLWEGQSASVIENRDREGELLSQHELPFQVRLDTFVLETYPGTMRPSGFSSNVQVTDRDGGKTFPARIWMNHELHHRGYALFQSSYQQEDGRQATVLSVAKDPGQNIVFTGYITLIIGMLMVLFTRMGQAREAAAIEARLSGTAARGALLALLVLAGAGVAQAAGASTESLRRLPVQHDGRSMPFDTLARETVWTVSGSYALNGQDPVETVGNWLFEPLASAAEPVVLVGSPAFHKAIGLAANVKYSSFMELVRTPALLQLMEKAHQMESQNRPRAGVLADAEKLEKRLLAMQSILSKEALRPIPIPGQPKARWNPPADASAAGVAGLMAGPRLEGWPQAGQLDQEIFYNRLNPARLSWIILLLAMAVSIAAWVRRSKLLDGIAFAVLLGGLAMMSWGIALRWSAGERIPAANMYESMLFLAWGVGVFAVIAYAVLRNRVVVLNAAFMAALTMALTDLLPIDRFIHPIAPVLAGTPWLAIHVPIIMVSYSILALGLVVAHMQVGVTIFAPRRFELLDKLYDLNYWYMFTGSIFLIAGIITGSMWAASSWGRYWGWDPKEVWSLVAFLAYMAILHAKLDRLIGKFGVAVISIIAFQTIIMTYLGVNFVLSTGMHSYGMGDSPVVMWMLLVAVAEAIFLAYGIVSYRESRKA